LAIIDPDGLFGGDRLRRCSNEAQLHWPRLFLASNGQGRLELNYAGIVGRAYATFHPIPDEEELDSILEEYIENYLLFPYEVNGQIWGEWDTRTELLPRYKTAQDRRSPAPPAHELAQWKKEYRAGNKGFPKSSGSLSGTFLYGVGIGGGKSICASDDAQACLSNASQEELPPAAGIVKVEQGDGFASIQKGWFEQWWAIYWRRRDRKRAWHAFQQHVRTQARFEQVMAATKAQAPEMKSIEEKFRPHGSTWLNGERWNDDVASPQQKTNISNYYEELK
jgi:hypothetical protein